MGSEQENIYTLDDFSCYVLGIVVLNQLRCLRTMA